MNSWIDFKYACRLLASKPGFTVITILIMALGMGLCINNYSFIHAAALKPLPFANGERMVVLSLQVDGSLWTGDAHRLESFRELSTQARSFAHLGFLESLTANVSGGDYAVRYQAAAVKPDLFDYTGTYPLLGRPFTAEDSGADARPVALISHRMWQNYFGGMEAIVGYRMTVNGADTEIIGVMPRGFGFPFAQDLWLPNEADTTRLDDAARKKRVMVYGLLQPGVTMAAATVEVQSLYRRLAAQDPEEYRNREPLLQTFPLAFLGGGSREILVTMSVAVVFVLLLACVNVANLLYSRAAERAKETAIRAALGAPGRRLIMQMLWESLIICTAGGVFALLLAQVGLEITDSIMIFITGGEPPYFWDFSIDLHVLSLSLVLILATAVFTGILPAWKITSGDFNQVLRDGTRGAQGLHAGRVNRLLVVFEVALSCALLTVSAMIAVASYQARNADYGFETADILTAQIALPERRYPGKESQTRFFEDLIDHLNRQPGIDAAFLANPLPGKSAYYRPIEVEGFDKTADNHYPNANSAELSPGAMEALGFRLLAGRYFDGSDRAGSMPVAVVTDSFVKSVWPGSGDVLGRRIRFAADDSSDDHPWMTVVGVVAHVIQGQPYMPQKMYPTIYAPMAQNQWHVSSLLIKSKRDPMELVPQMNAALRSIDKEVPAYYVLSLAETLKINTAGMDFISGLFNVFAVVALALAGSGIYAVIANAVQRRTHELGVRRALGASDAQVVTMLMRQGWRQLLVGIMIGLPVAYMMGDLVLKTIGERTMEVYGMLVAMPLLIAVVVLVATRIPARRAVLLEPADALHYE